MLVAVNLYLEAVAGASRIEAVARAGGDRASAVPPGAGHEGAGLVAGIDVLRAQVQAAEPAPAVIGRENEFEKLEAAARHARSGCRSGRRSSLTDKIPYAPMTGAHARGRVDARGSNPRRLSRGARARRRRRGLAGGGRCAASRRCSVDADYGAIGQTPSTRAHDLPMARDRPRADLRRRPRARRGASRPTRSEAHAKRSWQTSRAASRSKCAAALLDVHAAVAAARGGADNGDAGADRSSQQARDRFAAGVASNLEVTQAQEAVATASDSYIAALYANNLAKASLARALGIAEAAVTAYLGGQQ